MSQISEQQEILIEDSAEPELLLQQVFSQLSYEQSSAITLNTSFGYTHEEVAEIMQLPVGTVKSHITRGKTKLKAILNPPQSKGVA